MSAIPDFDTVLVPMQLDAFVLNPAVCNETDKGARISPITQPNYTFLRLDNFLIQADVQNHADLHATAPSLVNSRMTDLGSWPKKPLRHRHGVYVHWTLPRFYRSGISSGDTVPRERRTRERLRRGMTVPEGGAGTNDTPDFVEPPTRWVVIREIDVDSIQPEDARASFKDKKYQAWVVQSDHLWSLDQIPLDLDLQTDMAPFVVGRAGSDVEIEEQAEVFIGRKMPLEEWNGTEDAHAQPPNLSLLRSSNQLFADFQMHNANVFSVLDNFRYGDDKDPKYLTKAKSSYYVLGWHWKQEVDPLWNSGKTVTHGASLDALFMNLLGVKLDDSWQDGTSQLRIMCHGAMYDVTWDHEKPPKEVPANGYSERLRDQTVPAISVGTTPMDALISYCSARKDKPGTPADIAKLEEDILAIESLLHARDDGVEGQREAKDTIYTWAFARSPGGTHYHFSDGDDGQVGPQGPLKPSDKAIKALQDLNQTQMLLDACSSTVLQYRWEMFSAWWKYVSDVSNKDDPQKNGDFKRLTDDISARVKALRDRIVTLKTTVDNMLHPTDPQQESENVLAAAKPASRPAFYLSNDPTVLIGGIESGWPLDFLDNISVRAPFETIAPKTGSPGLPQALKDLIALLQGKLPDVFRLPAGSLLTEFHFLRPGGGDSGKPPGGQSYPQFHDTITTDGRWRDQWGDRQPWFPLYAEWEVEYTHVPFEFWKLDEHTARLSANKLARYGISVPTSEPPPPPPLWKALPAVHDTRVLSGRVLILPQPSFSLQAKVMQLFQNTPPAILDQYLPESDREDLLNNIKKLSYLSSTLSGLNNGLITQAQGSHIKPENKTVGPQGEESSAIAAAAFAAAGLTVDNINLIQGNSALTPYAALVNFLDTSFCPFKPVTHGQFRFRKLNIIDKFGQSLMAIDQAPRAGGPPPIYPAISDFYEPQTIKLDGEDYANTVLEQNPKLCEFLQLPPQINQNARFNANFVKRVAETDRLAKWRPATEWEMPIWGWVITNYADYGIQLFLPDGTFYREVRFGGPLGALVAPKWMPFAPDRGSTGEDETQLDALVDKLTDPEYLKGFWHMITTAQDNLPPAPTAYAQFLNSIVGKPLALVNMGWSLELDKPPLTNQSTKSTVTKPERMLTHPRNEDPSPYYRFQVRLGDKEREYDGLVGYFDTTTSTSDKLNLDYINTFFAPEDPSQAIKPLQRLNTTNYPLFTAFWQPPFPTGPPYIDPIDPADFEDRRNAKMSVFGAIVDPFTAVHASSSFLPPMALSLPPWTWQSAMDTMTAFFHAGPVTLPIQQVPGFKADQILTSKNSRDMPLRDLPLLGLAAGDWSWFQPYAEAAPTARQARAQDDDPPAPVFNSFGIEKRGDVLKPGFQAGPYTAVEGFLQLRHPIMMPKGEPEGNPKAT